MLAPELFELFVLFGGVNDRNPSLLPRFALLFAAGELPLFGGVNERNPSLFPRLAFVFAGLFPGRFAAGVATRASFGDIAGA